MNENKHVELWNKCLTFIKDNLEEAQFSTWFEPVRPVGFDGGVLTIGVPSPFFYEYLEEHYVKLLASAITKEIGPGTKLNYQVLADADSSTTVDMQGASASGIQARSIHGANKAPTFGSTSVRDLDPHLIPHYSFDNFIEGVSNQFSRGVAETVARNPEMARAFNPLFLYGPSGVGKTHLVNAIGAKIKENYPDKRVLYMSARLFQVQYTDSVINNKQNDFIRFYQTIDVLIIDDIQEIAGQKGTQNTFFHIFNHLHQNGRQIIMTSDTAPADLKGMADRLLTRFKWGLVAKLERPDKELRKEILRSKIRRDGLSIPESVVDYIADNVEDSVRELEGIINSLLAQSIIFNRNIDVSLAAAVLGKFVKVQQKTITVDDIIKTVCEFYGMEEARIHARCRKREVVNARQVAMFLTKKHTDFSTTKIGRLIGNKDHATVLHACRQVENQMNGDHDYKEEVEKIDALIKA